MSNLLSIPMIDDYETTLSQSWNGSATTINVNTIPTATTPAGSNYSYIVVDPGKSNMQVRKVTAWSAGALTVTTDTIEKGNGVNYTATSHTAGSVVRFSNNYAFRKDIQTAINTKLDSNGGNTSTTFDLDLSGSNFRIRKDGNSMKFTDDETAEVSLKTLTTASGADQYFSVSSADTTVGHGNDKLTAGDGLKKTIVNPGGAETLDFDVDVTDTTVFVKTSSGAGDENKVPVLNASGQLDNGFIPIQGNTISLIAGENITIGDNLCFGNTSASENPKSTDESTRLQRGRAAVPNTAQKITLSSVGYVQRLTSVKFNLYKANSPTDNVVIKLYNDDLVTIIEGSSAISGTAITADTGGAEYTFTFSTNILIPGKSYYLVLSRDGAEDNTNNYYVRDNSTGGTSEEYNFDGTDWTVATGRKFKYDHSITTYAVNPASVMKMDANDPLLIQDAGIAIETKTTGQAVKVQFGGIVPGLSGLTPNLYYYASDTAGALATTPSTTYNIRIGKAISATQLLIDKKKIYWYQRNFVATDQKYNGAAVDYNAAYSNKYIRIYTGFRPTKITTDAVSAGAAAYRITHGYSDGATNKYFGSQTVANTGAITSTSLCFSAYALNDLNTTLGGTINFLDNGFEVYYTKTGTGAFDGQTSCSFDVE